MVKPLIIIVGADKGGVGKTTVTRALRDYFELPRFAGLPRPTVWDTQFPAGDLVTFCHDAAVVNITSVSDQMKIFDHLDGVSLVDVQAGQLAYLLQACDEARLFDDVKTGALRVALLHVLGPSLSSLNEISTAVKMLGTAATHYVVKNHINETEYFAWDEHSVGAVALRALENATISIPHLDTVSNEAVQMIKASFVDFASGRVSSEDGRKPSRTLMGRVGKWLERSWSEFDRVGLGGMIETTFVP